MNQNAKTYRLLAFGLACLMLASSLNISIDMHYCKGELKSIALFGKAKSCHEPAKNKKICPHHQKLQKEGNEEALAKKDCCKNRGLHINADIDEQVKVQELSAESRISLQFAVAFLNAFGAENAFKPATKLPVFERYKPPLISRDIPVLNESFLL